MSGAGFSWIPPRCLRAFVIYAVFYSSVLRTGNALNCADLLMGQYRCDEPIFPADTQRPQTCQPDNSLILYCEVAPGISCTGTEPGTPTRFAMRIADACTPLGTYDYSTALGLSVFFGWLGADRFYLGYHALGFIKLFSMGGFMILYLLDVVLISLELLGPADGGRYFMDVYGPRVVPMRFSNLTYVAPYTCFDCANTAVGFNNVLPSNEL